MIQYTHIPFKGYKARGCEHPLGEEHNARMRGKDEVMANAETVNKAATGARRRGYGMPCAKWRRMTEENKHIQVRIDIAKWFAEWLGKTYCDVARAKLEDYRSYFKAVLSSVNETHIFPLKARERYCRKTSEMLRYVGFYDGIAAQKAGDCL